MTNDDDVSKVQIIEHPDVMRCFMDTEFYEDGTTIDLISIGAVRSDGEELYYVNRDAKLHLVSPWVREHVLPLLPVYGSPEWQPRSVIADRFSRFLAGTHRGHGPDQREPVKEVWSYYADYDWVAVAQMYGTMMGLPNHFPKFCLDLKQFSEMVGSPRHPKQTGVEHHSLLDARYHHELYAFLRRIRKTSADFWLHLDEGERQALLLALGHLAADRPGWDDLLNRIAVRIDNVTAGRAVMFDQFRTSATLSGDNLIIGGAPK